MRYLITLILSLVFVTPVFVLAQTQTFNWTGFYAGAHFGYGFAETRIGAALVVDGDTLLVAGDHVRLLNMDAFGSDQTCTWDGTEYPCGTDATRTLIGLISENEIRCEGDKRDRYNRPLVHCWVGDLDLGKEMVRAGWAISANGTEYRADQEEAWRTRAGVWAGTFQNPADWRREHSR
jgi:endonuclease YncB( thermonuclease family)